MKILVTSAPDGSLSQYSLGILNAMNEIGGGAAIWNRQQKSTHDAFAEYGPDVLFLESVTWIDRSVVKCVTKYNTKLVIGLEEYNSSDMDKFAELLNQIPLDKRFVFAKVHGPEIPDVFARWKQEIICLPYALDTTNYGFGLKGLKHFECNVTYVGGYDPKNEILNNYLLSLCNPIGDYSVKIFGNKVWPVPQFLGYINVEDVTNLYASAVTTLHIQNNPNIIHEKVYQILGAGGVLVTFPPNNLTSVFGDAIVTVEDLSQLKKLINSYINNSKNREEQVKRSLKAVLPHIYQNRVKHLYDKLHINI